MAHVKGEPIQTEGLSQGRSHERVHEMVGPEHHNVAILAGSDAEELVQEHPDPVSYEQRRHVGMDGTTEGGLGAAAAPVIDGGVSKEELEAIAEVRTVTDGPFCCVFRGPSWRGYADISSGKVTDIGAARAVRSLLSNPPCRTPDASSASLTGDCCLVSCCFAGGICIGECVSLHRTACASGLSTCSMAVFPWILTQTDCCSLHLHTSFAALG